jgi:hypothetical protein
MMRRFAASLLLFLFVLGIIACSRNQVAAIAAAGDSDLETLITLGSPIAITGYNPAGVTVVDTTATIIAGGEFRVTGMLADGMIAVNTTDEVTLTLDNASITHSSGPAIYGINSAKLALVLAPATTNLLGDGSTSTPSNSSHQRVVVFQSGNAVGTVIRITSSTGAEALTFQVSKDYQTMVFTSPALVSSTTYTVLTGGSVSGGDNFHGLYTGSTYSGGSTKSTFTTGAVVTYVR